MGLLRRIFGPALDASPPGVVKDGHQHAPDANPEDVYLPKQKGSSDSLLAAKPPAGWERQASEASGGIWPWHGGESPNGHHFGGDLGGKSSSGTD